MSRTLSFAKISRALNRTLFPVIALVILGFSPCAAAEEQSPYQLGPGDVIDLYVWKNIDVSRQISVQPDGMIRIPLAGQIRAGGLTIKALTAKIRDGLAPFIPDPEISLSVQQLNSLSIYVTGKVSRPGRFQLHDRVNVLQAISLAGGLTPFAREKTIRILRKTPEGTTVFPFNYKSVSKGKDLEQNILLERGDVLVIK